MESPIFGCDQVALGYTSVPSQKAFDHFLRNPQGLSGGSAYAVPDWIPIECSGSEDTLPTSEFHRTFRSSSFCDSSIKIDDSFGPAPWEPFSYEGFTDENFNPTKTERNYSSFQLPSYNKFDSRSKENDADLFLQYETWNPEGENAPKPLPSVKPAWTTTSKDNSKLSLGSRNPYKSSKITKHDNGSRNKKTSSSSRKKSVSSDYGIDPSPNRISHNLTEKRYRTRLNGQFELLLSALPANLVADYSGSVIFGSGEQRISKSEVLILAKNYIESLEEKREELERQNQLLVNDGEQMNQVWGGLGQQIG